MAFAGAIINITENPHDQPNIVVRFVKIGTKVTPGWEFTNDGVHFRAVGHSNGAEWAVELLLNENSVPLQFAENQHKFFQKPYKIVAYRPLRNAHQVVGLDYHGTDMDGVVLPHDAFDGDCTPFWFPHWDRNTNSGLFVRTDREKPQYVGGGHFQIVGKAPNELKMKVCEELGANGWQEY